jgi:hypothetical protein
MLDKLRRREQDRMEEEVYVSMNNYDVLKKSRRFKFR